MSWTKRQFIMQALEEIGLASYVFDSQPEQLESASRRLDSMIASWNAEGIRISYPIPSSPENSNLDDETNVPDSANKAIFLGLAIELAPAFGKTVSPDTKMNAKSAYNALLAQATQPPKRQFPGTLPTGAGNKPWRWEDNAYFPEPTEPLEVGNDDTLEFD